MDAPAAESKATNRLDAWLQREKESGRFYDVRVVYQHGRIAAYVDGEEQAQIFDRERAIIYLYIGNALAFQDDWESALREYLESVQTDPQLAEAHYNLGVAFAALGQLDRAVGAFKETLEHNPTLYEAHFALGRCYQKIDDAGARGIDARLQRRHQRREVRVCQCYVHDGVGLRLQFLSR